MGVFSFGWGKRFCKRIAHAFHEAPHHISSRLCRKCPELRLNLAHCLLFIGVNSRKARVDKGAGALVPIPRDS
jgi:hypothetical protein